MKHFDSLFSLFAAVLLSALLPFSMESDARSASHDPQPFSYPLVEGSLEEDDGNETPDA